MMTIANMLAAQNDPADVAPLERAIHMQIVPRARTYITREQIREWRAQYRRAHKHGAMTREILAAAGVKI
jgi:hypothetical protein